MESMSRFFRLTKNKEEREAQLAFGFFQLFIELSAKIRETERLKKKARKNGKTEEVIQYINENYDGDITMEQVAEKFGLSSRYTVSYTHLKYLMNERIEGAKDLLRETNMSVGDICRKVGYNDLKHFTRLFEKNVGVKPGVYRKLYRCV